MEPVAQQRGKGGQGAHERQDEDQDGAVCGQILRGREEKEWPTTLGLSFMGVLSFFVNHTGLVYFLQAMPVGHMGVLSDHHLQCVSFSLLLFFGTSFGLRITECLNVSIGVLS